MRKHLTPLLLSAALASPALAAVPLRDLHPGQHTLAPAPSDLVTPRATVGGTLYFTAFDEQAGEELWRTDGTAAGTTRVKDIVPGPQGASPNLLTPVGNTLFFHAPSDTGVRALWKTDGTEGGTVRVKDFPNVFKELVAVGNTVFFNGFFTSPDTSGVWKSDGTEAGTLRVSEARESRLLTPVGNTLFFSTRSYGTTLVDTLWKLDGTSLGATSVWALPPGSELSALTAVGDTLYAQVFETGIQRLALWKTDGTASGAVRLGELSTTWASPYVPVASGSRLFLLGSDYTLWTSDGTPSGTVRLASFVTLGTHAVARDGRLFFVASQTSWSRQAWTSDGTPAGTVALKELSGTFPDDSAGPAALGDGVYFLARGATCAPSTACWQLWRTDGTAAGTEMRVALPPQQGASSFAHLSTAGGALYFGGHATHLDAPLYGLWRSDGTAAGTGKVGLARPHGRGSLPSAFTRSGGGVFFTAEDATAGRELWRTDGTASGTARVRDFTPGPGAPASSAPMRPVELDGARFVFHPTSAGLELWRTDGTEAGTTRVTTLPSQYADFAPPLVRSGRALFFMHWDSAHGYELWRTDGTAAGTARFKDIHPGAGSSSPLMLVDVHGTLFFTAQDATHGRELWKSDGTEGGTVRVKDLQPGTDTLFNFEDTAVQAGGTLYFTTGLGRMTSAVRLWKSDGTEGGTVRLHDAVAPSSHLVPVGGAVYFTGYTFEQGHEPWMSDGTATGTVRLKDIQPGSQSSAPFGFTALGRGVLFFASDEAHGFEPWWTDGTPEGTARVKDVRPGPAGSVLPGGAWPLVLEEKGVAVFTAMDAQSGLEPWVTDGSAEGTERLADLVPGPGSSAPREWTRLGDSLLCAAHDDASGTELYSLALPSAATDRSPPTVTCPAAVTQEASSAEGAQVTYLPATARDVQGVPTLGSSHASGSLFPVGTTQVTVTASDAAGNQGQCTFAVTVRPLPVKPEVPVPGKPDVPKEGGGCSASAGAPGAGLAWGLLALLSGVGARRRQRR